MRGFVDVAVLLHEVGAIGVWGNHDCGLAGEVDDEIRDLCDARVLEFTGRLQPHVSLGDCHFSHVEPWLDPHDVTQLWYLMVLRIRPRRHPSVFRPSLTDFFSWGIFIGGC